MAPLTPRQRDVLACAARGLTAIETARELHVSEGTVWKVRAEAIVRLEASNIASAIAVAVKRGELGS